MFDIITIDGLNISCDSREVGLLFLNYIVYSITQMLLFFLSLIPYKSAVFSATVTFSLKWEDRWRFNGVKLLKPVKGFSFPVQTSTCFRRTRDVSTAAGWWRTTRQRWGDLEYTRQERPPTGWAAGDGRHLTFSTQDIVVRYFDGDRCAVSCSSTSARL